MSSDTLSAASSFYSSFIFHVFFFFLFFFINHAGHSFFALINWTENVLIFLHEERLIVSKYGIKCTVLLHSPDATEAHP